MPGHFCRLLALLCFSLVASSTGVDAQGAGNGARRGGRPARFYRWPLSQIRGDKMSGRLKEPLDQPARRRQHSRWSSMQQHATELSPVSGDSSGMRYWRKGLANASPTPLPPTDRYVSFEPWAGGFNNIRMSLEIAMALAIATNRTLVLPDKYRMYKLPGVSAWDDFFDLEDMARGVPIMHQRDFQAKIGLPDESGKAEFPTAPKRFKVRNYIAKGWQGIWEMARVYGMGEDGLGADLAVGMIYCVPDCPEPGSEWYEEFQTYRKGKLPFVSTSSWDVAPSNKPKYKNIIHFSQNGLGHWYTSIFIRPKVLDVQHKEAMKIHCHFNDNIFDYAEKVLVKLREVAPSFSCIHVRRGDFQFKDVWTPVNKTMSNVKELFRAGEHMWVMTEEKNPHAFFAEMKESYKLHFLKDYTTLLMGAKPALYPMIESVVCSRARVFSGTFKSTLTGYIHRLRGYMDDTEDKNIYFNQVKFPEGYAQDLHVGIGTKYPTWVHAKGVAPGTGVPAWAREYREVWDRDWNIKVHQLEAVPSNRPHRRRARRNNVNHLA